MSIDKHSKISHKMPRQVNKDKYISRLDRKILSKLFKIDTEFVSILSSTKITDKDFQLLIDGLSYKLKLLNERLDEEIKKDSSLNKFK